MERSVELRIGSGDSVEVVSSLPEEDHDSLLTREETTTAAYYVRFRLTPAQVEAFARGPVSLAIDHPHYSDGLLGVVSSDATRAELSADLTTSGSCPATGLVDGRRALRAIPSRGQWRALWGPPGCSGREPGRDRLVPVGLRLVESVSGVGTPWFFAGGG